MRGLKPTQVTKTFTREDDGSGYSYDIVATLTPERGWKAEVTFKSWGATTPGDAIRHMEHAVEHFLSDLEEGRPEDCPELSR